MMGISTLLHLDLGSSNSRTLGQAGSFRSYKRHYARTRQDRDRQSMIGGGRSWTVRHYHGQSSAVRAVRGCLFTAHRPVLPRFARQRWPPEATFHGPCFSARSWTSVS